MIKITSRDPAPPPISYIKKSGGIFLDMTIHDFDMVKYLSGSEISELYVKGGCFVDPEIKKANDVDTAVINMTLKNGVLATINNSRKAVYGYDQRIEVLGSKGILKVPNRLLHNVEKGSKDGFTLSVCGCIHSTSNIYTLNPLVFISKNVTFTGSRNDIKNIYKIFSDSRLTSGKSYFGYT